MVEPFIITIILLVSLYFLSRSTLRHMSTMLFYVFKNTKVAYFLLALFFLPGTIVHEMAHAVVAICLFLKIKEIAIFPKIEKNKIILGYVMYEKTDPMRSFMTGIAPFFIGILLLVLIPYLIRGASFWTEIVWLYAVFTITTMMFFSDSDMEQAYIVLPLLGMFLVILFFVFNLRIGPVWTERIYEAVNYIAGAVNKYLFFSLILHAGFIILIKSIKRSH